MPRMTKPNRARLGFALLYACAHLVAVLKANPDIWEMMKGRAPLNDAVLKLADAMENLNEARPEGE